MELGLNGKTAVVTGGSRGIGLETARAFLQEGANVAFCGRNQKALDEALEALSPLGNVLAIKADATSQEDMERFALETAQRFGGIHCWVNNVGASIKRADEQYTPDEIRKTVAVCFESAVYGCQTAFKYMKDTGGAIVNVSSLAARCGTAGRSTLYGPLKAAVRELAVMFAAEYVAYNIRVNTVLPGFTMTPTVERTISPKELAYNEEGTLLRRMAKPEEIAWSIVFLCSNKASYITATSLEVSGGRSVVLNPGFSYEKDI